LGCKGPVTGCDIPLRGWNSGINSCIKSGGICIGCTEADYPDHANEGLFTGREGDEESIPVANSSKDFTLSTLKRK